MKRTAAYSAAHAVCLAVVSLTAVPAAVFLLLMFGTSTLCSKILDKLERRRKKTNDVIPLWSEETDKKYAHPEITS